MLAILVGVIATLFTPAPTSADERIAPREYWLLRGYTPAPHRVDRGDESTAGTEVAPWPAHSLAWPVTFEDTRHSIGNATAEFQSYGDGPYYHGGCDLRVARAAAVRSPVAGRVEAGHYGYSTRADGSMEKFWYPWPKSGDRTYFEVSVITDDGFRFEFHHMDETRLSPEILQLLRPQHDGQNRDAGRIAAGTLLGNTIAWPDGVYHHTHYNILSPTGVQYNPEHFSSALEDHHAPQVSKVIASFASGKTQYMSNGSRFVDVPQFFAVAVLDRLDADAYDHPPVYASIRFENGQSFAWDFRERLLGADGKFPPLWDFYVDSIRGPDGQTYATEGGYGIGESVIRLPVPQGGQGKFTIEISDDAGNSTQYQGSAGISRMSKN